MFIEFLFKERKYQVAANNERYSLIPGTDSMLDVHLVFIEIGLIIASVVARRPWAKARSYLTPSLYSICCISFRCSWYSVTWLMTDKLLCGGQQYRVFILCRVYLLLVSISP